MLHICKSRSGQHPLISPFGWFGPNVIVVSVIEPCLRFNRIADAYPSGLWRNHNKGIHVSHAGLLRIWGLPGGDRWNRPPAGSTKKGMMGHNDGGRRVFTGAFFKVFGMPKGKCGQPQEHGAFDDCNFPFWEQAYWWQ